MKNSLECKNCGFQIEENFCQFCGQRSSVYKVTFKETFTDLIDSVFSINAPLIKTIKLLFLNPGKLFRDFLDGKRKSYYKPVAFFIITTFVYLIVRSLINYNPMTTAGVKVGGELLIDAGKYMVKNINNIMFLFVFSLALFLKAFFRKRNNLAEFVAVSFYLMGVYTLIGLVAMFYLKYIDSSYKMLPVFLFYLYTVYALTSFLNSRKFFTIVKISLVYLFSFIMYSGIGFLLSFLAVWYKSS